MQDPEPVNEPLAELAESLRALKPAPPSTSPREIWYQAGVQAGRRRAGIWRGTSLAFAVTTAGLLTWSLRPAPTPSERIVYVRPAAPPPPPQVAASPDAYAKLRDAILLNGLDGFPPPDFTAGGEPVRHDSRPMFSPDEFAPLRSAISPRG